VLPAWLSPCLILHGRLLEGGVRHSYAERNIVAHAHLSPFRGRAGGAGRIALAETGNARETAHDLPRADTTSASNVRRGRVSAARGIGHSARLPLGHRAGSADSGRREFAAAQLPAVREHGGAGAHPEGL